MCVCVCMYACTYAHMYVHMHTKIHTYVRSYIHTKIHPSIHPSIHPCIHTYIHTYIYVVLLRPSTAGSDFDKAGFGPPRLGGASGVIGQWDIGQEKSPHKAQDIIHLVDTLPTSERKKIMMHLNRPTAAHIRPTSPVRELVRGQDADDSKPLKPHGHTYGYIPRPQSRSVTPHITAVGVDRSSFATKMGFKRSVSAEPFAIFKIPPGSFDQVLQVCVCT